MGWLGLAWDIQAVPARIYREARRAAPEPTPVVAPSEVYPAFDVTAALNSNE